MLRLILKGASNLKPYLQFFFRNYWRSHRYLREIIFLVIFHIFFWGFLYGESPEDQIWTVFGVLALLLNLVTAPTLFYLERGNDRNFALVRPLGRIRFFLAKIVLIVLIDFFWVALFSMVYGIRFWESEYFLLLPVRLIFILLLLVLSTSLLGLSFTFRPFIAWLLLLLVVFGSILNKVALFPPESWQEAYVFITLALPPFLEIIFSAVSLKFPLWRVVFLGVALLQILFYLWLNLRFMLRKDFAD